MSHCHMLLAADLSIAPNMGHGSFELSAQADNEGRLRRRPFGISKAAGQMTDSRGVPPMADHRTGSEPTSFKHLFPACGD